MAESLSLPPDHPSSSVIGSCRTRHRPIFGKVTPRNFHSGCSRFWWSNAVSAIIPTWPTFRPFRRLRHGLIAWSATFEAGGRNDRDTPFICPVPVLHALTHTGASPIGGVRGWCGLDATDMRPLWFGCIPCASGTGRPGSIGPRFVLHVRNYAHRRDTAVLCSESGRVVWSSLARTAPVPLDLLVLRIWPLLP
jgi:hypothetical protein